MIPDAVATPVRVARRAGLAPGARVAVLAAGGGVGIHMVQVARAYGADGAGLDVVASKPAFLADSLGVAAVDSSDFASVRLPRSSGEQADVVVDLYGRVPLAALGDGAPGPQRHARRLDHIPRRVVRRVVARAGGAAAVTARLAATLDAVRAGTILGRATLACLTGRSGPGVTYPPGHAPRARDCSCPGAMPPPCGALTSQILAVLA
ncbi:MAG TPA: hypothetical protein VMC83_22245, partial [Streptosporangiaceae bacterium]|nr:hypothetical protein [Streptosporangiaceae bacterium]